MSSPEIEKCEANQRVAVVQLRELAKLIETGAITVVTVTPGANPEIVEVDSFPDKQFKRGRGPHTCFLNMQFIRKE